MTSFTLSKKKSRKVADSMIVAGATRSGTTILGKVIHSMKRVEYALEPPMLSSLIPMIDELEKESWKLLYETYLYEEFLISALAGRSINCNLVDDSSIYNCKLKIEVEKRLSRSFSKDELQKYAENTIIAYKSPLTVNYINKIKEYYPSKSVVVIVRNFADVLYSNISYGLFTDDSLRNNHLIWPDRNFNNKSAPFFVQGEFIEKWWELDIPNRIAYFYIRMYENVVNIPDVYIVHYENLVNEPRMQIDNLCNRFGLEFGGKTEEILNTIKQRTHKDRDPKILSRVREDYQNRISNITCKLKNMGCL